MCSDIGKSQDLSGNTKRGFLFVLIANGETTEQERNEEKMNNDKKAHDRPHLKKNVKQSGAMYIFANLIALVCVLNMSNAFAAYSIEYGTYTWGIDASQKIGKYGTGNTPLFTSWPYSQNYTIANSSCTSIKHKFSSSTTEKASWVKDVRFGLTPDDTLVSGFSGMYSPYLRTVTNRGAPREFDVSGAFSIKPTISAIVEENNTSEERACYVDIIVESTASYWMQLKDSTSKAIYRCYFIQEAGSSTVSVTLDSNGGADAAPYRSYSYTNGNTYRQWNRNVERWEFPTTSRAGFIFDAWYTYAPDFPEVHNLPIDETTKTTARVKKIIAHWKFEPPQNFTATQDLTDRVSLSWEPVANLNASYGIYRSEENVCPAKPIWTGTAQSYDDVLAESEKSYYYWVKASGIDNGLSITSADGESVIGMRKMAQIATPTISPADDAIFFGSSEKVSLECATQGASIYYTTDGTTPDANSALYVSPFSISETTTIKAVAIKDGMKTSEIATATITRQLQLSLNAALDTDIAITANGSAEWIGVRDSAAKVGVGYAKSGVIGNRQSTSLSVIVSGKGAFSFWWRVSCEGYGEYDCDLATFSAPDADIQELKRDGIMPEWEKITASFSTDGEHTLTWTYKKDKSDADGDDCLYLDGFSWTPATPDPIVWTITFNLNGADAQDGTSPKSINDATAIGTLPTPTRDGYTFAGWWTEAEGGTEVTATTTVASDMTLFAHWTEKLPPAPTHTETTPVPVRHDWLAKYSGIMSAAGNDYEAAAMRPTGKKDGKGNALCVWHDYLAGTDPTNANSVFRAKVEFENGLPRVGWEPDLNENGRKSDRFYKVFGKKTLAANENWTRLADEAAQRDYNFFKVTVNMEDTPDTEEELKFGDVSGTGGNDDSDGDNRPVLFSAPYNVSARGVQGCVSIGWRSDISYSSDSSKWVDFCIYKADVNDISKAVKIKTLSEHATYIPNSCEDVVDDFDIHYYWVRIETKTARSEYSECASAAAILTGPKNLTATANRKDGVLLTWDALPLADLYKVFADDDNGYNFTREIGDASGTSIFDSAAPAGKIIRYKVLTMSQNANEYSYSCINGARYGGEILAPVVSGSGNTEDIGISWQPVVGAISYDIYRNTAKNTSSAIKIDTVRPQGLNGIGYRDTTVDIGKIYYYWVKTVYESGESGFSNVFNGARFAPHPTNVKATTLRCDGILLTWDPVVGATSYRIYGSGDTLIKETTDCRWLDTTVAQGASRMYKRVTSVCAAGEYELGGEVYLSGYRTTTDSISSVAMTGKSELELANGNKLSLLCTATMASGEKLTVYPEAWDFSDLPEGSYTCERPNEYLYLTIDKRCFAGEGEKTITIRATWTSTERDCDPTVYNLSHKVVVHPAE